MNSALCPPSNILSKKDAASLCNFLQWCCYWTVLLEHQLHTIIFYYICFITVLSCLSSPETFEELLPGVCVCVPECVCVCVCVCVPESVCA